MKVKRRSSESEGWKCWIQFLAFAKRTKSQSESPAKLKTVTLKLKTLWVNKWLLHVLSASYWKMGNLHRTISHSQCDWQTDRQWRRVSLTMTTRWQTVPTVTSLSTRTKSSPDARGQAVKVIRHDELMTCLHRPPTPPTHLRPHTTNNSKEEPMKLKPHGVQLVMTGVATCQFPVSLDVSEGR